jgi:hypothetical protein
MILVWKGSSLIIVLSLILLSFAFNAEIYLNYDSSRFDDINWSTPFIMNSIFTFWWSYVCWKFAKLPDNNTWLKNLFISWGNTHSLFFVDIKIWGFVFLAAGLYIFFR